MFDLLKRLLVQSQQLEQSLKYVHSYNKGTGNSLLGRMMSQTRPVKIKSFLPFNFAITAICVAIRLAEDRTRMGSI